MRKEIENWWTQANRDLITAQNSFESGDYYASVFWCQQSIEKALKAYFMVIKQESPGVTHSLLFLAKETKVPKEFMDFLVKLTPEFIATRYPDVADEIPAKLYTEGSAKEFLEKTGRFMTWLRGQMPKQ